MNIPAQVLTAIGQLKAALNAIEGADLPHGGGAGTALEDALERLDSALAFLDDELPRVNGSAAAAATGATNRQWQRWLKGQTPLPTHMLWRLAKHLGWTPEELMLRVKAIAEAYEALHAEGDTP